MQACEGFSGIPENPSWSHSALRKLVLIKHMSQIYKTGPTL